MGNVVKGVPPFNNPPCLFISAWQCQLLSMAGNGPPKRHRITHKMSYVHVHMRTHPYTIMSLQKSFPNKPEEHSPNSGGREKVLLLGWLEKLYGFPKANSEWRERDIRSLPLTCQRSTFLTLHVLLALNEMGSPSFPNQPVEHC